jgi:hypothetical protein
MYNLKIGVDSPGANIKRNKSEVLLAARIRSGDN